MNTIQSLLRHAADAMRGELGAVATEYGLLLLLIALVIILAVTAYGISLSGAFQTGANAFP